MMSLRDLDGLRSNTCNQLAPTVNADERAPARQAIEGFSPNASMRRLGVVKNAPTTRRTVLDPIPIS